MIPLLRSTMCLIRSLLVLEISKKWMVQSITISALVSMDLRLSDHAKTFRREQVRLMVSSLIGSIRNLINVQEIDHHRALTMKKPLKRITQTESTSMCVSHASMNSRTLDSKVSEISTLEVMILVMPSQMTGNRTFTLESRSSKSGATPATTGNLWMDPLVNGRMSRQWSVSIIRLTTATDFQRSRSSKLVLKITTILLQSNFRLASIALRSELWWPSTEETLWAPSLELVLLTRTTQSANPNAMSLRSVQKRRPINGSEVVQFN